MSEHCVSKKLLNRRNIAVHRIAKITYVSRTRKKHIHGERWFIDGITMQPNDSPELGWIVQWRPHFALSNVLSEAHNLIFHEMCAPHPPFMTLASSKFTAQLFIVSSIRFITMKSPSGLRAHIIWHVRFGFSVWIRCFAHKSCAFIFKSLHFTCSHVMLLAFCSIMFHWLRERRSKTSN